MHFQLTLMTASHTQPPPHLPPKYSYMFINKSFMLLFQEFFVSLSVPVFRV